MKKIISLAVILILGVVVLSGCTEVNKVSSNISQQADNFNITRRIAVINARSDKPIFELVRKFFITKQF